MTTVVATGISHAGLMQVHEIGRTRYEKATGTSCACDAVDVIVVRPFDFESKKSKGERKDERKGGAKNEEKNEGETSDEGKNGDEDDE
ncbi:MAG: hypothetical protein Q9182_006645 [Xanthomendoza sp. 2 TL-2023]